MEANKALIKTITVSDQKELYIRHFQILNAILPVKLTDMQMQVLAEFMLEPVEYRFGTDARRKVSARLKLSRAGMSNYLKELALKGFLVKSTGTNKYAINETILPVSEDSCAYAFKLVLQ